MGNTIRAQMTPSRRVWLESLLDGPKARPGCSHAGFDCANLGWSEWDYRRKDSGEPISSQQAREEFGIRWWEFVENSEFKERITDAGRAALKAAEEGK